MVSLSNDRGHPKHRDALDRLLAGVQRSLLREASLAFGMLDNAIELLWTLDADEAKLIRRRDDRVDAQEVQIEQQCIKIIALQQPMARDLRLISFALRVNADFERVADHACSIAKVVILMDRYGVRPTWPTAFKEMAERVPLVSQKLLRAVVDEDMQAAQQIIKDDEIIDRLHDRVFDETVEQMRQEIDLPETGLLIHRATRELERVADLMASVAESVVYLGSGEIVRHGKRLARAAAVLQAAQEGKRAPRQASRPDQRDTGAA